MVEKKSVPNNMPAVLAATGGLITAIVGLLTFMSTPAPSIVAFDASPNIIVPGETSILKWSVTGEGATVVIEPNIGAVALSGTREVAPDVTTNYTLTARIKDQEKVASLQLVVREKARSDPVAPAVAPSDAPSLEDQEAQYVRKEPEVAQADTEASEEINAVESKVETAAKTNAKPAIAAQSDSQQKAVAETALAAVASISASTEPVSNIEQEAGVESDQAIDSETAILTRITPEPAPEAEAPVESHPAESAPVQSIESVTVEKATAASGVADPDAGSGSDTAADVGITYAKPVRAITSADWNRTEISRSKNDFSRTAPIYTKLRSVSPNSAQRPDVQDIAISDPGLHGSDDMSMDINSQGPQSGDMQSTDALGPDPLSPDIQPPETLGPEASGMGPA